MRADALIRRGDAPTGGLIALAMTAACAGDGLALLALAAGSGWTGLACHGAGMLGVAACATRAAGTDGRAAAALRLLAIGLPCFGPFAILAAFAGLLPRRAATGGDAQAWHAHLFPTLAADTLAEDIQALHRLPPEAEGSTTVSFRNVLQFGSLEQQEYVIALMSRSPRPNFAPLFQEALGSHQPGVRAQAAAGLSLLETRMNGQTRALRDDLARAIDASGREESMALLARQLDIVANSGLMDGMRTQAARGEALAIWEHLANRDAGRSDVQGALGLELAALGRHTQAITPLWTARAAGDAQPAVLDQLCDCLLQTGRLDDLHHVLSVTGDRDELRQFWLDGAA